MIVILAQSFQRGKIVHLEMIKKNDNFGKSK